MTRAPVASVAERARVLLARTGYHNVAVIAEREIRVPSQFEYDVARSIRATAEVLRVTVAIERDGSDFLATFGVRS